MYYVLVVRKERTVKYEHTDLYKAVVAFVTLCEKVQMEEEFVLVAVMSGINGDVIVEKSFNIGSTVS